MTHTVVPHRDTPADLGAKSAPAPVQNGQYVTFRCNGQDYGVDIMSVREIRSWSPTTILPNQPRGACGVLDIRGEVIQVFDLNAMIGGTATEATEGHIVLVVSVDGFTAGILADSVSDIIEVGPNDLREPPATGNEQKGVVSALANHQDSLVALLNLAQLLGRKPH